MICKGVFDSKKESDYYDKLMENDAMSDKCEDCDWTTTDSYMCKHCVHNKTCIKNQWCFNCRDSTLCFKCAQCETCIKCINCEGCDNCERCVNCYYCSGEIDRQYCICGYEFTHKQFDVLVKMFLNQQIKFGTSKDEIEQFLRYKIVKNFLKQNATI